MPPPEWRTVGDLLHSRASKAADDNAYAFVSARGQEIGSLTFAQLAARARVVAARLLADGRPGDRVLLMFQPGLEFLVAFFGCLLAGTVAVPIKQPGRFARRDAGAAIVRDCTPRFALTDFQDAAESREYFPPVEFLAVDFLSTDADGGPDLQAIELPTVEPGDLAFLQYTSGSTGDPKGVEVTHNCLLSNLEMIRLALGNTRASTHVCWLPLYHDMGLILNALQTLYLGAPCVLLAPATFMQRPVAWLKAISEYAAEIAGGPNFAFELCCDHYRPDQMRGVDLSSWKVAVNGAEPVRTSTIDRFCAIFRPHGFDPAAFYPAYGMAEATLLIAGGIRGGGAGRRAVSRAALRQNRVGAPHSEADTQELVACGRALAGEQITIVDPEREVRVGTDEIGEVWVSGPNICRGYWRNPGASHENFRASLPGSPGQRWLRTGDLGFVDSSGRLYLTGRIKDVVVIRGINHYPQDIEHTVETSHPALRRHCGAAFAIVDAAGEERLAVVHELNRDPNSAEMLDDIVDSIREAVAEEHELTAYRVALIRRGTLPKTTSGKIQRRRTRDLWMAGLLPEYGTAVSGAAHIEPSARTVQP